MYNSKNKLIFLINCVLFLFIFYYIFIHDWHQIDEPSFFSLLPIADPMIALDEGSSFSESIPPWNIVEETKTHPLFIEGRRRIEREAVAETLTILVDGTQSSAELVGTIEGNGRSAVAFILDRKETTWLHQNEYLGNWQIQEIKQHEVRLTDQQEILVLRLRKLLAD